jgi:hypothetical protein
MSVCCSRGLLYLNRHLLLKIWEVAAIILLNMFLMPLACISPPCLRLIICRSDLLMESQSSCIFYSHFFILFYVFICFFFFIIYTLSSSPKILSSTCSNLLEWLSTIFLFGLSSFFISRVSMFFPRFLCLY